MKCRALHALAKYGKVKAKMSTQQQVYDGILFALNLTKKVFSFFYVRLYIKTFAVNLIRTTQTVSLQRDNYNIKMCLNSSEISIIFSSANAVSSVNLILNIPGCFLYKGK